MSFSSLKSLKGFPNSLKLKLQILNLTHKVLLHNLVAIYLCSHLKPLSFSHFCLLPLQRSEFQQHTGLSSYHWLRNEFLLNNNYKKYYLLKARFEVEDESSLSWRTMWKWEYASWLGNGLQPGKMENGNTRLRLWLRWGGLRCIRAVMGGPEDVLRWLAHQDFYICCLKQCIS